MLYEKKTKKRKVLPFPFSLIVILCFISIVLCQFGINDWIHPNSKNILPNSSRDYIEIINDYHVGLKKQNVLLDVSEHIYGLRYSKSKNQTKFIVGITRNKSILQFLENEFLFSLNKKYSEIDFKYLIKRKNLQIDLNLSKKTSIKGLSYSVSFYRDITPKIKMFIRNEISKKPFYLIIDYTDFSYSVNNIFLNNSEYTYGFTYYDNNKYRLECMLQYHSWELNSYGSSQYEKISINYDNNRGLNNSVNIIGSIFNDYQSIKVSYYNQLFDIGADFKNSPNYFFKINQLLNENYIFLLDYEFEFYQFKYNLSFLDRNFKSSNSNRMRTSGINTDFESLILDFAGSSSFVNSQNFININENLISMKIRFPKIKSLLKPLLQIDWINDKGSLNVSSQGYTFIKRIFEDDRTYLISREAFNFKLRFTLNNKDWLSDLSFSQHFPYKLEFSKENDQIISNPDSDEIPTQPNLESSSRNQIYGGLLITLNFTKYLN